MYGIQRGKRRGFHNSSYGGFKHHMQSSNASDRTFIDEEYENDYYEEDERSNVIPAQNYPLSNRRRVLISSGDYEAEGDGPYSNFQDGEAEFQIGKMSSRCFTKSVPKRDSLKSHNGSHAPPVKDFSLRNFEVAESNEGYTKRKGLLLTPPQHTRLPIEIDNEFDYEDQYRDHRYHSSHSLHSAHSEHYDIIDDVDFVDDEEVYDPRYHHSLPQKNHAYIENDCVETRGRYVETSSYPRNSVQHQSIHRDHFRRKPVSSVRTEELDHFGVPPLQKTVACCSLCGHEGPFVCTACGEPYCSKQCQMEDWPDHSRRCRIRHQSSLSVGPLRARDHSRNSLENDYDSFEDDICLGNENDRGNVNVPRIGHLPPHQKLRDHSQQFMTKRNMQHKFQDNNYVDSASEDSDKFHLPKELQHSSQGRRNQMNLAAESSDTELKYKDLKKAFLNPHVCDEVKVTYCASPEDFWVIRSAHEKAFNDIYNKLSMLKKKKSPFHTPTVGDVCSVLHNDSLYRCYIIKIFDDDTCEVYFLDYGNKERTVFSNLYCLTDELSSYPTLAIRCGLTKVSPLGEDGWRSEVIDMFAIIVENKVLEARVINPKGQKTIVDLITDEDLSISSIFMDMISAQKDSGGPAMKTLGNGEHIDDGVESLYQVPSVLNSLRENTKISIIPILAEENRLWGWVDAGRLVSELRDLEHVIDDERGEEITHIAEEGEIVVAFSPSYEKWFRSIITRRTRNAISVRHIDYGLEETVSKVFRLPEEHMNVICPVLCIKTARFPRNITDKLEKRFQAVVISESSEEVVLGLVDVNNFEIFCYPWYYGLTGTVEIDEPVCPPKVLSGMIVEPKSSIGSAPNEPKSIVSSIENRRSSPQKENLSKVMQDVLVDREFPTTGLVKVVVVWAKSKNELYVQRVSDYPLLEKMSAAINNWCNSCAEQYLPSKDQVVCAKYSADGNWYRSLVLRVSSKTNKFEVFFVDFGNIEIVPAECIRELKDSFNDKKYSSLVCLAEIPPQLTATDIVTSLSEKVLDLEMVDNNVSPKKVKLYNKGRNVFENDSQSTSKPPNSGKNSLVSSDKGGNISVLKRSCLEDRTGAYHDSEVRIANIDKNKFIFVQLVSSKRDYFELKKNLETFYNGISSSNFNLETGDLVCIKLENMQYVRGCIVKSVSKQKYLVDFFDRGGVREVFVSNMKPLTKLFVPYALSLQVEMDGINKDLFTEELGEKLKTGPLLHLEITDLSSVPVKGKFHLAGVCINDGLVDDDNDKKAKIDCVTKPPSFLFKSFKRQQLVFNQPQAVLFCHREEDKYFFHCLDDAHVISEICETLQNCCSASAPLFSELPSEGEVVCAKCSEDGSWYRACIKKKIDSDKCDVLYIDYGNSEMVHRNDLRPLGEKLAAFPLFVHRVTIDSSFESVDFGKPYKVIAYGSKLSPIVKIADNNDSKEQAVEYHSTYTLDSLEKQTLPLGKTADVVFQFGDKGVFFVHKSTDNDRVEEMTSILQKWCNDSKGLLRVPIIGEVLCTKCADDQLWHRVCIKTILSDESFEVTFIDYGNSEKVGKKDVCELPAAITKFPVFAIPTSLKIATPIALDTIYSVNVTGDAQNLVVEILNSVNTSVENKSNISKSVSLSSMTKQSLPLDAVIDVVFQFQDEDGKFYLQKAYDADAISKMATDLQQLCGEQKPLSRDPEVGEVLCAKSAADSVWYRGCVKTVLSGESYEITFIDYGNIEQIEKKNLCELPATVATCPVFAITTTLKALPSKELAIDTVYFVAVSGSAENLLVEIVENTVKNSNETSNAHLLSMMKKESLPIDSIVDVRFQFQDAEGKFYLQKACDADAILKLAIDLQRLCGESKPLIRIPMVGEVLSAKSACDNLWYRGCIKAILSDESYEVTFIDYGNIEEIKKNNLCELPPALTTYPIFSIPTTLKSVPSNELAIDTVYSIAVSGNAQNLLVEIVDNTVKNSNETKSNAYMLSMLKKETLLINSIVNVMFQFQDANGKFYLHKACDVDAILKLGTDLQRLCGEQKPLSRDPQVGEILCAKSAADSLWYRGCVKTVLSGESYEITFIDYGNIEQTEKKNLCELPATVATCPVFSITTTLKTLPSKELAIDTVYSVAVSGSAENLIVEIVDDTVKNFNDTKSNVYLLSMLKKESLPINSMVDVMFQFQDVDGKFYVQKACDADAIFKLATDLQRLCGEQKSLSRDPEIGEVLCAKSAADGLWYRCCVKTVTGESYEVTFIDYGNLEEIEKKNICELPVALATYPIFSIPTSLKSLPSKELAIDTVYSVAVSGSVQNLLVEIVDNTVKISGEPKTSAAAEETYLLSMLKKEYLPIDCIVDVVFQFQDAEKKFYLQKASDAATILKMATDLQQMCKEQKLLSRIPAVGEVLCAKSAADNFWYRAYIKQLEKDGIYLVTFFDFGNSEQVKKENLCELPEAMKMFPIFAYSVSLKSPKEIAFDNMYSVLVTGSNENPFVEFTSPEPSFTIESFQRDTLTIGETVDVIFCHNNGQKLYLQKKSSIESIKEVSLLLSQHCNETRPMKRSPIKNDVLCCKSSGEQSYCRICVVDCHEDTCNVMLLDYGFSEKIARDNLWCLPKEMVSLPIFCITVELVNHSNGISCGPVYKVKVCGTTEKLLVEIIPDGAIPPISGEDPGLKVDSLKTVGDAEEIKSLNNFESTKCPKAVLSDCKYVEFPCGAVEVMIYSVTSYDSVFCAPYDQSNIVANAQLSDEINKFCNDTNVLYQPTEDTEMVLAKSPDDDCWYRAAVLEITDNKITVLFIDYGNCCSLDNNCIRKMEPRFIELPIQAHFCRISDIVAGDEQKEAVLLTAVKELLPEYTMQNAVLAKDKDGFFIQFPEVTKKLLEKGLISKQITFKESFPI